jgi:hypothetical protein
MKVALVYGYAEGPRIAKEFVSTLYRLGHKLVSATDADVIIAHSGGSFMIPDKNNAKVVMLVDVPYYDNHKSFVKKLYRRVAEEGWSLKSIRKFSWNNWYVVSNPKRCWRMYRAVIVGSFHGVNGKRVVLVRNSQDLFGVIAQDKQEAKKINADVKELPGTHDDIWVHPEVYIKLAEKQL